MSALKIYKASAGAGKTFKLVQEYISILIQNPNEYKHILAVTFTNDATEEMKSRVLQELETLSTNPAQSKYQEALVNLSGKDSFFLQKRAAEALSLILHDYSNFHIITIDTFFQKILRSFAKDIGLPAAYNLELDTELALTEITEKLVAKTTPDNKQTRWILKAAKAKIEEGKNWNIRDELKQLFNETFKENYQIKESSISLSYMNEDQIDQLQTDTQEAIQKFEEDIVNLSQKCNQILKEFGLSKEQFKGKRSSFYNWIDNLSRGKFDPPGKAFLNAVGNVENWFTKTAEQDLVQNITNAFHGGLNEAINVTFEYYKKNVTLYNSNLLIRSNLSYFALFEQMSNELSDYKHDNDLLFISDTNQFISQIIGTENEFHGNEEAFIFEKVGTHFHHYLIDEFQDTSLLQWKNFKPLISNAISQGDVALVVGDVKQSIYRFRNGDWRLLHEIAEQEISVVENIPLNLNHRSCENIIKFNNSLFELAPDIIANIYRGDVEGENYWETKFSECYGGHTQKIPLENNGSGGFVKVKLHSKPDPKESTFETILEAQLHELFKDIDDALQRGYQPNQITILVFRKKEAQIIASFLQEQIEKGLLNKDLNIITQNALNISNSHGVKLIIAAFRCLVNYKDTISRHHLATEYELYLNGNEKTTESIEEGAELAEKLFKNTKLLQSLPLNILVQEIIELFHLHRDKQHHIFLQGFKDAIQEYLQNNPDDLMTFMDWWQEYHVNYNIEVPSSPNSLQVLTIHKSKGLEFDVVLIPFANWDLDSTGLKGDLMWLEINDSTNTTVPIRYSSKMADSTFKADYFKNKFYNYLDRLNLLYVATTRAVKELYIYSENIQGFDASNPEKASIRSIFNHLFKAQYEITGDETIPLMDYISRRDIIIGEKTQPGTEEMELEAVPLPITFQGTGIFGALSFKSNAIDLRKSNDTPDEEKRIKGILFHEILAEANSLEQSLTKLNKLLAKRKIDQSSYAMFATDLKGLFNNKEYKYWSENYASLSEYTISYYNQLLKPDKILIGENRAIVVDFKTGKQLPEYEEQVKLYTKAVSEIYPNLAVSGYLYFTQNQKLEPVIS